MLDKERRGFPDDQTLATLSERVFSMPILKKLKILQEAPVCLFPKVDMCREFNEEMLADLPSPTKELEATTLIDETVTIRDSLEEKVKKKLEELKKDVTNARGLEANLKLVVEARVMLHAIVEEGLVNGALGTEQTISATRITVKFDRIANLCEIEQVKRKFMVMKYVFVYRSQFPLILASAVTIHKCQGLLLDNAIIDSSNNVFKEGMAYVALSQTYHNDIPAGIIDEPQAKNEITTQPPNVAHDKKSRPSDSKEDGCPKKPPVNNSEYRLRRSAPSPSTTIRYDPAKLGPTGYRPFPR
uniref:ATP-dependent DNA helicase n=1 Tax=Amphimedon queenslandica TaxID=400682 RepID=A0A1X7V261_AMPQE